jgi:hypothetical protein
MTEEEKNKIRTRTNISVSLETRERVGRLGYAGQSLESVLIALLDENEGRRKEEAAEGFNGSPTSRQPSTSSISPMETHPSL